jgi:hypothetical protein
MVEALIALLLQWLMLLWIKVMVLRFLRQYVMILLADPLVTGLSIAIGAPLGLWLAWRDW